MEELCDRHNVSGGSLWRGAERRRESHRIGRLPGRFQAISHLGGRAGYHERLRHFVGHQAAGVHEATVPHCRLNGLRLFAEAVRGEVRFVLLPSVDAWLDRFHFLGINGVTLGIKLPLLLPSFGPHSEAYTAFFATVVEHARARGMTVDVELGPLFCGMALLATRDPDASGAI